MCRSNKHLLGMNAMSMTSMSEDLKEVIQHNKRRSNNSLRGKGTQRAQREEGIGGKECIPESWVGED